MQDFNYCTPTKVFFGKDKIQELPKLVKSIGKRVLLVYGGGSIKKLGLYDKVKGLLQDCEIYELPGVEPNPRVSSVREGSKICKEKNIDVVLAVGGGSVIDCSKAICAGAKYDGDPWDLVLDSSKVHAALPLIDVLTLSATGSEYDAGAVISNLQTEQKLALVHPLLFPKYSILDPQYTFSVNKYHTAAGASDIMSHIMEQYFVLGSNMVSDGLCETILKTVMVNTKKVFENENDYDARAQLMWASSLACNGICSLGNTPSPWVCHGMEHELSAFYDITHGVGLAIVTPRWMEYSLNDKTVARFANFANKVFDVPMQGDLYKVAKEGINKLVEFYKSVQIPMHLKEVGIDEQKLRQMAQCAIDNGSFESAIRPLNVDDVEAIFRNCL